MSEISSSARARLALAAAARELADHAHGLVGDVGEDLDRGELLAQGRRLCALAQTVKERAEVVDGHRPAWGILAEGPPVDVPLGEFEVGGYYDPDPVGTARALDTWHARHAEPWDARVPAHPVTRALT